MAARLKSAVRVEAFLRRASGGGAFAVVLRRGDPDAGVIWVVSRQKDILSLYRERMSFDGGREWHCETPLDQAALDMKINREVDRDPDIWVIEVEDAQGRVFLDGVEAKLESAAQSAAKALFRDR